MAAVACGIMLAWTPAYSEEQPTKDGATKDASKEEKTEDKKTTKARVYLANGDSLRGAPLSVDAEERLHFQSDSLQGEAIFPLKDVVALQLNAWKYRPRPETITRVELRPRFSETTGDLVMGTLHELTPDSIKLKTWFGGVISLKRSMVKSLKIIGNSPGSYYGPNNLAEWTLPGGEDSWAFHKTKLISQATATIGKDVGLTEKSHVSFTVNWKNSARFRVRLYANDVTENTPSAYYEVNINRSYAYLQTRGKSAAGRGGARFLGGARWRQLRMDQTKKKAKFDFYSDRKTGIVTLYIDGKQACVLQSQMPDPEDLGTALQFVSEERAPVEISNIVVTPWNGTSLPGIQSAMIEAPDVEGNGEKKKLPDVIILTNGDEVPGTVGKIENDRMIVETELTPIKIPLKRIKSFSLGDDAREQPKKYQGDIRAWLHEGGFITLRLKSFADGKIHGFSQAMGDVSFDLTAFNRIDFLIYDDAANELRKELP